MERVILILLVSILLSIILGSIYLLAVNLLGTYQPRHSGEQPTADMYYHPLPNGPKFKGLWQNAVDRMKFQGTKDPEQSVADLLWKKFWEGNHA